MKQNFLYCVCILMIFLCASCTGGTLKTNITTSPTPNVHYIPAQNTVRISGIKTVAIIPFADYSHQQDFMGVDSWGGNIKIQEEIADQLIAHGLSVVIQEDVNTVLVDNNIIRPVDKDKYLLYGTEENEDVAYKTVGTPEYELANYKHSPAMVSEIMDVIKLKNKNKDTGDSKSPVIQGATVGLTKEKVAEIADALNADLVIRGRIIEYGYKDIGTLNPLYRGFIPVVLDSAKDLLFGATGSYGYEQDLENIENILVGAAAGYAIGNNIVDSSSSYHSGISSGLVSRRVGSRHTSHDDHALEGAGIGAAAGWLASQHPKKAKRSAVVQVRIYAQDGKSGNVLWSNRAEIEYTPKSNFAYENTHPKVMFDKAIEQGIEQLMGNFFTDAETVFSDIEETAHVQKEGA